MSQLEIGFVFILSVFIESTLTIVMAASLPMPQVKARGSDESEVNRISQATSRASTAFWHDRGRPEDVNTTKSPYRPQPTPVNAPVVSSGPTADWHGHAPARGVSAIPYSDTKSNTIERLPGGGRVSPSPPRGLRTSLFGRTWSTISSALRDLEPIWAHRRMEAAMRPFSRPYTPSVYSSRTIDDDATSTMTSRWETNNIISRLSDIVEESWRDRSILKTPEPAALIYSTEKGVYPPRGSRSDWDIENGSMI